MPIVIVNFKETRRAMSVTPAKPCELTRNGLVYDHVRYRWNRAAVEDALDAGDRRLPAGLRTPGTAMVLVMIRVWDDDIDMIEVFDGETGTFHEMWSTEPEYTSGLSRWEHHQYLAMVKAGKGGASGEVDRLLLKGRSLREQDAILPQLAFRDRASGSALVEAEGYRRASGKRARSEGFSEVPELGLTMTPGGTVRDDLPTTPPQSAKTRRDRRGKAGGKAVPVAHRAPPRADDYSSTAPARALPEEDKGSVGRREDEERRSARLARWAALGHPAPDPSRSPDEPEQHGPRPSDPGPADYHLRDDEPELDDESGESVEYEDDSGDDEGREA